ncbi:MAG: hypothetical protein CVU09_11280 [Bacteroidetes bacterium HGW-Bacteroidetes-4]|jgi:hypothetical protein|nr:MAG: hypothetical protein CVU09_11280 [Bacteroidetes bacterium HGW-Bacteroidetes-4]
MKKKKIFKTIAIIAIAGLLIGGGTALYLFNMPHRDVQSAQADFTLTSSQIVNEYLTDKDAANAKYLAADGDSKILEIAGVVSKISDDFDGNKVILLKSEGDKSGVSATFTAETNKNLDGVNVGQSITVKGVIRSGASYDEDLEMYENVILEKSDIVNK